MREGLVALADGRVTAGNQIAQTKKLVLLGEGGDRFFIMTSGLRSVRDKVLAYLRQMADPAGMNPEAAQFPTMIDAVNSFARCLRRVRKEDEAALAASDLHFNLHAVIGGQLGQDSHPTLFLVYPEGNWIEVDERTPYLSIGSTGYGKPILDRALSFDTPLRDALKLAYLSFDSTRTSATDVGYPIDLIAYRHEERRWRETHLDQDALTLQRQWWNGQIAALAARMPDDPWRDALVGEAPLQIIQGGQARTPIS